MIFDRMQNPPWGGSLKPKTIFVIDQEYIPITLALGVILTNQNNRPFLRERRCEPPKAKIRHCSISEDRLLLLVCINCITSRLVTFSHYCLMSMFVIHIFASALYQLSWLTH